MINNENELKYFASNLSLLIVEDSKSFNKKLLDMFTPYFKTIDTAFDGLEGLKLYKEKQYDLVLSDLEMPNMSGEEMIKEIKLINKKQHIVVLSSKDAMECFIQLIDLKVDQFVHKTQPTDILMYYILKVIENINYERQFSNLLKRTDDNRVIPPIIEDTPSKKENIVTIDVTQANDDIFLSHKIQDASSFIDELTGNGDDTLSLNSLEDDIQDIQDFNSDFEAAVLKLEKNGLSQEITVQIMEAINNISNILHPIDKMRITTATLTELISLLVTIDINTLTYQQTLAFGTLVEFQHDLSTFINNVFIEQNVKDIHYLEDSLKSSVEQLKYHLTNEELDEEEFELF
jgi:DNA-binding NarL/FixJ family response regulator